MRASLALAATLLVTQAGAEKLTGEAIREALQGNTLVGTYIYGGEFSEYHAADGRALGDNGHSINVDACWNIDGDAICYHYGPMKDRRTYCFTVEREGDLFRQFSRDDGRLNAIARVLTGNPERHDDGGARWSCDDLLASSSRPGPSRGMWAGRR